MAETSSSYYPPSSGVALPYLVYTAIVTETGEGDNIPIPVILQNTLGQVPVWGYDSAGVYTLTESNGSFVLDKTVVFITPTGTTDFYINVDLANIPGNIITFITRGANEGTNNNWVDVSIEIRIYP